MLEEFQIKNNFQTNGAVKPYRNDVNIPEHKDEVDSVRPILKAARQKSMNGCPNFSSKKDLEDSFSFGHEDAKFGTKPPFSDGSTRNICSSEMILNSRRLFINKELVRDQNLYT